MRNEELVKMFNPTLKRRETILFFFIVVINRLTWIVSDIGLDMCARGRWVQEWKIGFLVHLGFEDFLELENPTPWDCLALSFSEMWYKIQIEDY